MTDRQFYANLISFVNNSYQEESEVIEMKNRTHYIMNQEIMDDLISCLKGNPKALDIMTDFTSAFIYMMKNVDDFSTDTLVDFQNDIIDKLIKRW